ncbi:HEAT repeat domain-containing protein [Armatimonas sp.]|uniref:HEAT repeat domain-containing protein n=1 Tax=Armatimonas sp. TaxID=1872638 RepID=UPI00286B41F5|nr:HEAT repeat domain-containing protein [Armatimonas sp.]
MFAFIRDVRCEAAEALGKLGDERGIAALLALCWDKDVRVRTDAITSLGLLGDEQEAPPFGFPPVSCPYSKSEALRNLDDTLERILTTLIRIGQSRFEEPSMRYMALAALGSIGEAHPMVLAALNSLRTDAEEGVRRAASWALGKLGAAEEAILESLYQELENGRRSDSGDWHALIVSSNALRVREVEAWIQTHDA